MTKLSPFVRKIQALNDEHNRRVYGHRLIRCFIIANLAKRGYRFLRHPDGTIIMLGLSEDVVARQEGTMEYLDHDYVLVCPQCLETARDLYPDAPEDYVVLLTEAGASLCEIGVHHQTL
jgi:hypothetical protein